MQVLPQAWLTPGLQTGCGTTAGMWQTAVLAMQVFPHTLPVVQFGAALAALAKANAATAASSRVPIVPPV
jgi:hypothetical protein